jgi:hypothetical protein
LNESQLIKHESNGTNYNNELKQFAVCWTGDWPEKKNKPTHFTINLVCALGKVQRVGTGLTQTVPPQAPMRGLSALNGGLKSYGAKRKLQTNFSIEFVCTEGRYWSVPGSQARRQDTPTYLGHRTKTVARLPRWLDPWSSRTLLQGIHESAFRMCPQ